MHGIKVIHVLYFTIETGDEVNNAAESSLVTTVEDVTPEQVTTEGISYCGIINLLLCKMFCTYSVWVDQ